jgi:hypothetical protein
VQVWARRRDRGNDLGGVDGGSRIATAVGREHDVRDGNTLGVRRDRHWVAELDK